MSDTEDMVQRILFLRVLPVAWAVLVGLVVGGVAVFNMTAALIAGAVLFAGGAYWFAVVSASGTAGLYSSVKLSVRLGYLVFALAPWITATIAILAFGNHPFWAALLASSAVGIVVQLLPNVGKLAFASSNQMNKEVEDAMQASIVPVDLSGGAVQRLQQEAAESTSLGPVADQLVKELIDIGRNNEFVRSKGMEGYDDNGRHKRTREIGEKLNELGGMDLMESASYRVTHVLGSRRDLENAWNNVGDWMA